MSQASTSWFACYTPRPDAMLRLIGFPHGGGGPQAFREWGKLLPDDVELIALNLPGRGSRLSDPLITDMAELVPHVVDALRAYFDKPFALFGHSVGAIVAYEVARELQQQQFPLPLRLFVSAHKAPHVAAHHRPMYDLPDTELVALLRDLGLVPEEALRNEGLLDFILPPLKADFQLSETYRCDAPMPLTIPVSALGGEADTFVTKEDLEDWQAYTKAAFDVALFADDHFYTRSRQAEVTQAIARALKADVAALPKSILHGEKAPYPDQCLHELFREQAAKTPEAVAVVGDNKSLTFGELDEQTDLLALYLQHQGVGVDSLVGIYMETSVAFVIAYLAALKAGGAYMPIEVAYPDALLSQVLDTAQPVVVLTNDKLYEHLPAAWQTQALPLDAGWVERLQAMALDVPEDQPQPTLDALAYCVMSSGTTGAPKGIVCPHRGAVNSYYWRYVHYPYEVGEREACNVFLVWEVIRPLLQGYPTYMIPDDVIYDPPRLVEFLSEHRITRVLFTPSLLEQVLNTPNLDVQAKLRHLRVVYLNGEVVTTALRNRFYSLLPQVTLLNDYSISECHDVCTYHLAELDPVLSPKYAPLGMPMTNVYIYLLDENLQPVPMGFQGEIYVGGDSVARGYLNEPQRTAERFIQDPIRNDGSRLFRTGDTGRLLPNGHLEIQGRVAFMVKLRGYSIVPGAVETAIAEHPAVNVAVVTTLDNEQTGQPEHLVAYVVSNGQVDDDTLVEQLRPYLRERLPHYAVPSYMIPLTELPLASIGKLDRRQLPKPDPETLRSRRGALTAPPATRLEQTMAAVWQDVLHTEIVDVTENFFDLGGHSLLAAELCARLREVLGVQVSVVDVFQYPTIRTLSQAYAHLTEAPAPVTVQTAAPSLTDTSIAVIGLSCRFPGADDAEQFWLNLRDGVCSIRPFSDEELRQRGVSPNVYNRSGYVKVGAVLDHADQFDPGFWGISKREAIYMDPQHRLFLECCWHALEHAGYAPSQNGARTGVFAGSFLPSYLLHCLQGGGLMDPSNPVLTHLTEIGNDKDYLATRVSHLLNLRGPSLTVQTSCSTGLVAVATACQALLAGQCDVALAGASSITFPQGGYQYQEGFVNSRDGQCRAFDAGASGTVFGDGVGVVALKRLADAEASGDHILAVIKGFAVNNDGNLKADYSAPSVQGQVEVVTAAQAMAGVDPETFSYIEAHGTGTLIGDPIEVRALTSAFRQSTERTAFCAIGSVKPNIGHSNIAAGVAGLIKVILSLQHRQLPPTINFAMPNPAMELESSPFFVNNRLTEWTVVDGAPRRAGITCLGIGGTNCHMVLEEWRGQRELVAEARPPDTQYLLTLSAKTPSSLEQNRLKLIDYLQSNPTVNLRDVAYTLHVGREIFAHRLALACHDTHSAVAQLRQTTGKPETMTVTSGGRRPTVFMFSGQGSQYLRMGWGLYQQFPAFRRHMQACRDILEPLIRVDLCALLYAEAEQPELFSRAYILQPALFTVEYAMARLLMDWGIQPSAVVGHSLGEYVAACLAGILSLEDALTLVATRGLAMEEAGEGAMLAVSLSEADARDFLQQRGARRFEDGLDVSLAAVNAPKRVVLSGSGQAVARAKQALTDAGVACKRVQVSRAFHSPMMKHAAEVVTRKAREITLQTPAIPIASNLTGGWLTDSQALDPAYWGAHMTQPVRFEANIRTILQQQPDVLLEIGPGRVLNGLATEISRRIPDLEAPLVLSTMRHPRETEATDPHVFLRTLGHLWTAGIDVDWHAFHADERPQRVPLPTYAFERYRCWPSQAVTEPKLNGVGVLPHAAERQLPLAERFYLPSWQRTLPPLRPSLTSAIRWLVFLPAAGLAGALGDILTTRLEQQGHHVERVYRAGDRLANLKQTAHVIHTAQADDYATLLQQLAADGAYPQRILYLWGLQCVEGSIEQELLDTYYPFLYLTQALMVQDRQEPLMLWAVTDKSVQLTDEGLNPVKATMFGPGLVLSQENPHVSCRMLDVQLSCGSGRLERLAERVLHECTALEPDGESLVALRGEHRWRPQYEAVRLEASANGADTRLDQVHQTYIITGGLGRIGLALAEHLATLPSKLVLTTRAPFPARSRWEMIAASSHVAPQLKETVQRLLKCEASGAVVRVIQADMANAADVQRMLTAALHHFGEIAGIFHAAGAANLRYLSTLTQDIAEQEFAPKLYGVLHLEQAIGKLSSKPGFVVLFSSMAAILGGLAMSAYAAANRFMDAFVQVEPHRHGLPWFSINWDDWDFVYDQQQIAVYERTQAQFAMSPAEGIEALERILALGRPMQLLVATRALPSRMAQWLHQSALPAQKSDRSTEVTADKTPLALEVPANGKHLEQHIVAIYQDVLGLPEVAADDNFFELGGDSLLASQILLQMRRQIPQVQLQLPAIFDYPTVREMTQYLVENHAE